MATLAPRLQPHEVTLVRDNLINILEESSIDDRNNSVSKAAGKGLAELILRLEPAQRPQAANALLKSISRGGHFIVPLPRLIALVEGISEDSLSTTALRILLNLLVLESHNSRNAPQMSIKDFSLGVENTTSRTKSFATLLSHPGCVGELREWMLPRFEELVLHEGRAVFLRPEVGFEEPADATQPENIPLPPRRFHNLHEAAAWIEQNWPDFDLETNHPVTWPK